LNVQSARENAQPHRAAVGPQQCQVDGEVTRKGSGSVGEFKFIVPVHRDELQLFGPAASARVSSVESFK